MGIPSMPFTPLTEPVILPTVGRVVWYWPDGDEIHRDTGRLNLRDIEQPFRADVCHVNADGTINISGNDHDGYAFVRRNVTLLQGDHEGTSLPRPFCSWMPYQRGQAAKADAPPPIVQVEKTPEEQLQHQHVRTARLINDGLAADNEIKRLKLAKLKKQANANSDG